ncbi:MAG: hypothetical protein K5739_10840 [Lachnospiraceae bacterium]|nr:hypothetical protein [Lachnospiraceae bacterium]
MNQKKKNLKILDVVKSQEHETGNVISCPNCGIYLFGDHQICPLCQSVTAETEEPERQKVGELFGENAPYPDVQLRQRLTRFVLKLVLFLFVVAEVIMVTINYFTGQGYPWSLITGVCLGYTYLFLLYWVTHDSGFAAKVGLQLLTTMILLLVIDNMNGMHGWSLQWAIPGIILLGDGLVIFLMMLNRSRWQSYMLLLLLMGICSVVILAVCMIGGLKHVLLPLLSALITGLYFFATMLFGGRDAGRELRRRFHI